MTKNCEQSGNPLNELVQIRTEILNRCLIITVSTNWRSRQDIPKYQKLGVCIEMMLLQAPTPPT